MNNREIAIQKINDETYQGIFDSIIDIVNSVSKEITKCR